MVHREQGWLPELAASVLEQPFPDLELIAIDDASPDHAPEMLDELAERDPRVRVRHLDTRVGPGPARNLGLDMAEGSYVWFVNTTDLVEAVEQPTGDLALVPCVRESVLGQRRPESGEGQIWSRIIRRELIADLRFGEGLGSELTVLWPASFRAEQTAGVDAASYVRRVPPNAEPEPGSPFDVFAQYEAVLDVAPDRGPVVTAMLRHELSLLATRVPEPQRREFFERMSEAYSGAGHPARFDSRGLELRAKLVERGDWLAYQAFERSLELRDAPNRARRAAGRVKRALKPAGRNDRQRFYRRRQREPLDPHLAVFAAYWFRGYSCNPRAIYERARELAPHIHGIWVVNTDGAASVPDGVDYVMAGSRDYFDLIARASWFVNNVNFPNNLMKREGQTHVMTHHGTPLKHMGLDLRTTADGGERAGLPGLLRRCSRWDFSVSQNAFTTPIWERVYPTRYESLETGYPRNDRLANATEDDYARVREELGIEPQRKVVLYTPTHREYQQEYVPVLDLAAVADGLGEEWLILARAHYFYESDEQMHELHRAGRLKDVSKHPSIEDLCIAADVLVTDYSSIMFDYAVLDRPIVIHAPDWDEYRTRRGTYFDLTEERPGPITTSAGELVEVLRSGEDGVRDRTAFRARFSYLDDGRAAERVVRRVLLGEKDALPPVTRPRAVAR